MEPGPFGFTEHFRDGIINEGDDLAITLEGQEIASTPRTSLAWTALRV